MATYLLVNRGTDEYLGAFEGDTPEAALDAYARAQGFDSFDAYQAVLMCMPGEFVAVEWTRPAPKG